LALGRHGRLVPELRRLVMAEPLRERLWGQWMLALYRSGRQAEALAAYQQLRGRLVEELGIEPGPPLQQLQRRILRGGGVPAPPPPPPPPATGRRRSPRWCRGGSRRTRSARTVGGLAVASGGCWLAFGWIAACRRRRLPSGRG